MAAAKPASPPPAAARAREASQRLARPGRRGGSPGAPPLSSISEERLRKAVRAPAMARASLFRLFCHASWKSWRETDFYTFVRGCTAAGLASAALFVIFSDDTHFYSITHQLLHDGESIIIVASVTGTKQ